MVACSRRSIGKRDRKIQAEQGRNKTTKNAGGLGRANEGTPVNVFLKVFAPIWSPDTTVCGLGFGVVSQT